MNKKDLEKVIMKVSQDDEDEMDFSIGYFENFIDYDKILSSAIKFFNGRTINFGSGSMSPRVVVVTKKPISDSAKNKLKSGFNKMGLNPELDVYFLTYQFIKTRRFKKERHQYVLDVISILNPSAVLCFNDLINVDDINAFTFSLSFDSEEIISATATVTTQMNTVFKKINKNL